LLVVEAATSRRANVRVSTAFNKMLLIPGAWVASVTFAPEGVVVGLRRRRRRLVCPCGFPTRACYDRRIRRWRHLDLAASKLWLQAEIRRLRCPSCGVRTEQVPWARPKARHTRDFEDVATWLAQRTDKTAVSDLLRSSWETIDDMVTRVVADHMDAPRLHDLYRIGVDEISYKRGHEYLTIVADHDTGRVVWAAEGRSSEILDQFFAELGEQGREQLVAASMDMGTAYLKSTRESVPHARICIDPFHVMAMINRAVDSVFSKATSTRGELRLDGRAWRRLRTAVRTGRERLRAEQQALMTQMRSTRSELFRAWEIKEAFRDLYRIVKPEDAAAYLDAWFTRVARSRIRPLVDLARRLRRHRDGILAAVELGLSNSRLEGINAKIRVIQRRGYGYHSAPALIAMTHLCCGGITVTLPTKR
jgi:transposase